jgi:hypothetical protein
MRRSEWFKRPWSNVWLRTYWLDRAVLIDFWRLLLLSSQSSNSNASSAVLPVGGPLLHIENVLDRVAEAAPRFLVSCITTCSMVSQSIPQTHLLDTTLVCSCQFPLVMELLRQGGGGGLDSGDITNNHTTATLVVRSNVSCRLSNEAATNDNSNRTGSSIASTMAAIASNPVGIGPSLCNTFTRIVRDDNDDRAVALARIKTAWTDFKEKFAFP